jgi:hypothetical protein
MIHLDAKSTDVDSVTEQPWPRRMDTEQTARYLREVHGITIEKKTLENMRHAGRGPKFNYFGQKPLCDRPEADRYADEDALQDESPLSRRRREREERQRARPAETNHTTTA